MSTFQGNAPSVGKIKTLGLLSMSAIAPIGVNASPTSFLGVVDGSTGSAPITKDSHPLNNDKVAELQRALEEANREIIVLKAQMILQLQDKQSLSWADQFEEDLMKESKSLQSIRQLLETNARLVGERNEVRALLNSTNRQICQPQQQLEEETQAAANRAQNEVKDSHMGNISGPERVLHKTERRQAIADKEVLEVTLARAKLRTEKAEQKAFLTCQLLNAACSLPTKLDIQKDVSCDVKASAGTKVASFQDVKTYIDELWEAYQSTEKASNADELIGCKLKTVTLESHMRMLGELKEKNTRLRHDINNLKAEKVRQNWEMDLLYEKIQEMRKALTLFPNGLH